MKKILVIGAGFLQKFVIQRAKKLGYQVYAVDGNPDAVGFKYADHYKAINIVDSDACLKYARDNRVDGVLTAATDYGVITSSIIAEKMGLNGISPDSAKLIKNKYLVRKCLFENQVDDTEQAHLVSNDDDIKRISKLVKYPVMVKPCDGSGSRGAGRADDQKSFEDGCRKAMDNSLTRRATVESFIDGEEYGVESFVENGNIHILAVMRKWMTNPPYYAELGHAVPSGLSIDLEEKTKECVRKALIALGVNFGSVNMDLLITKEGSVHIIDIGARMGGNLIGSHIIPLGTGIDYMGNMIRAAVGDEVDFSSKKKSAVATRLLALTPGIVKSLPDFDCLSEKYGAIIEHHLRCGDEITPYRTNLDGCGYVVLCGENENECAAKAEEVKNIIDKAIIRV